MKINHYNMARKGRFLIFTIPVVIVLACFVAYQYGYLRIRGELSSIKELQGIKTRTLQKYVTLISWKPLLEEKLAALTETRKADDSKLISEQTLSLAAATLQNMIRGIITARAGTIISERVEKPEELGKFKVVSVNINATLPDTSALSDTLYAIETQTPYLVIKELDVSVKNHTEPRELIVRLRVAGLTGGK